MHLRALVLVLAAVLGAGCSSGAAFEGRVVDALTRRGIEGVTVTATTSTQIREEQEAARLTTTTDAEGRFQLTGALPGRIYRVLADRELFVPASADARAPEEDQTYLLEQPLSLAPFPTVRARVVDCFTEQPLTEAEVAFGDHSAEHEGGTYTAHLPPGERVSVRVSGSGRITSHVEVQIPVGQAEFQLPALASCPWEPDGEALWSRVDGELRRVFAVSIVGDQRWLARPTEQWTSGTPYIRRPDLDPLLIRNPSGLFIVRVNDIPMSSRVYALRFFDRTVVPGSREEGYEWNRGVLVYGPDFTIEPGFYFGITSYEPRYLCCRRFDVQARAQSTTLNSLALDYVGRDQEGNETRLIRVPEGAPRAIVGTRGVYVVSR